MIAALVLAPALTTPAHAGDVGGPGISGRIDDRIVVRLLAPGGPRALDAFVAAFEAFPGHESFALTPIDQVPGRPIHLLDLATPEGTNLEPVALALEGGAFAAHLVWGEFLYEDDAPEGAEGTTGSTYVDSIAPDFFTGQYLRGQIGLDAAQARSSGATVTVAVLDTGLDPSHPLFQSGVVPGWDFVDGDGDTQEIADGIDQDGDGETDEMFGHGTYVAGLVRLVAPDARIMPIRVLDTEGNGDGWRLILGMFAAVDGGVEVINASIRSTYGSAAVEDAIDEAVSLGIVVVAAAGNFGIDRREFPAAKSGAIGVIAVDDADVKATFSSYNDKMDLTAPGDSVFSGGTPVLGRSIVSALPGGDYGVWEGTSFSTPLVSGAAALVRSQYPQWPTTESTATNVRTLLETTAVDISAQNPGFDPDDLGAGRLDAGAAAAAGPIAPEVGDVNGDGIVGFLDIVAVIDDWGLVHTNADANGDGVVDLLDLLLVLSRWT